MNHPWRCTSFERVPKRRFTSAGKSRLVEDFQRWTKNGQLVLSVQTARAAEGDGALSERRYHIRGRDPFSAKSPAPHAIFWPTHNKAVFLHVPKSMQTQKAMSARIEDIKKFRNRIFHHQTLLRRRNSVCKSACMLIKFLFGLLLKDQLFCCDRWLLGAL